MKQYKFCINFQKEEAWLAAQSRKGRLFIGRTALGGYLFTQGPPKETVYRIDYRTFQNQRDFDDYVALFWDSGWRHISGSKWSGAQYFAGERTERDADLFSDRSSRAGRYRRLCGMFAGLLLLYAGMFAVLAAAGLVDFRAVFDMKALYYTPGLWDLRGTAFWSSFLFETPFAIGRGFSWMVFPLGFGVFTFLLIKTLLLGRSKG